MIASYLPHERDARTKGTPSLGSGAIYPVAETDFVIDPVKLPAWYEYAFGLDVGWKRTAAIWGARDPETDVLYIWSEHYQGEEKPVVHAQAIRARGDWIPGVIDPAARGRQQGDGERLMEQYVELRIYRRDENGKIVKENDHAVDALRYLVMSGLDKALQTPISKVAAARVKHVSDYSPLNEFYNLNK